MFKNYPILKNLIDMRKYAYGLLLVMLILLVFALSMVNKIKAPYIEYASLPRCSNNVVVTDELRSSLINYSSSTIVKGTGESYFNNHFIFKKLDYSLPNCVFVVRYEYTYDQLHSEMSVTIRVPSQNESEITETNTFLRPVGLLVSSAEAESVAKAQNDTYDYYNVVIDAGRQTFLYKFYRETLTEGTVLIMVIDGQSKEIMPVQTVKDFVPIV
jgi:hypothetical protein